MDAQPIDKPYRGGGQMRLSEPERDRLFQLYLASRSHEIEWMNRHSTQFEHYLTLVLAILAISLGAGYHFLVTRPDVSWLWWAVGGASIVNAVVVIAALKACDRSYQRFLEEVTISAKLEGLFGYDEHRPNDRQQDNNEPDSPQSPPIRFPDDTRLIPDRWVKSRAKHRKGTNFRKAKMKGGVNFWVRLTWILLCGSNAMIAIGAVLVALEKVVIPAP